MLYSEYVLFWTYNVNLVFIQRFYMIRFNVLRDLILIPANSDTAKKQYTVPVK